MLSSSFSLSVSLSSNELDSFSRSLWASFSEDLVDLVDFDDLDDFEDLDDLSDEFEFSSELSSSDFFFFGLK